MGVPLPKAGSFQDAVLQEALFREQNLRFTEMSLIVSLVQRLINAIAVGPLKSEALSGCFENTATDSKELLRLYEIELYQDRYSVVEARKEKERKREADAEARQKILDQQRSMERVKNFTE